MIYFNVTKHFKALITLIKDILSNNKKSLPFEKCTKLILTSCPRLLTILTDLCLSRITGPDVL